MPSTATDRLNGLTTSVAVKAPCRTVATTNITLAGLQTVSGVALVENDRVLVAGQSSSVDNGIYNASTGDWTRALDFDGNRDVVQGTIVSVVNGSSGANIYEVTSANPITIDTTAITFSLRYGANIRYDRTQAEIAVGVTPTDYAYEPGQIRRYGAVVDGVTLDTAAWQAAIDQCRAGGYPVKHLSGTSATAQLNIGDNLEIMIAPAAKVLFAPNQANFQRMFTSTGAYIYDSAVDSRPLRIHGGGTLDGNQANQGSYSAGQKEQCHCIFLTAASTSGGRLKAFIDNITCINSTGDGVAVYANVDLTFNSLTQIDCYRSGLSITGGNTKIRGYGLRGHGATWPSDFDIEVDGAGYNGSHVVDIEIDGMDIEGSFDVGPYAGDATTASRIILSKVNHTGTSTNLGGRGSVVKITDSVLTFGPLDGSSNRILWPADMTLDNVTCIFREGAVSATSTFGLDVWFNTGGTTDTNQKLTLKNCRYKADSTVDAGDSAYGVNVQGNAASENNIVEIDGGIFDASLDEVIHLVAGGKILIKNAPTIECPMLLSLTYSSTNYYDVRVYGSMNLGAGVTTYCRMDQGNSNNVLTHYNSLMDEAFNVFTAGGGSPQSNVHRGNRTIMVASAPTSATHGNVGDRAVIKTPAAAGVVEYVCTTRGWGSGAVWKALTTAAA